MGLTTAEADEVIANFEEFHEATRRFDESQASKKADTAAKQGSAPSAP